jgi:hypothetical protein
VLSPNGTASPISETGLPPLYGAKQLWLYAPGIVARPSSIECFRLLELSDSVRENLIQANNGAVDEIYLEAAAGAGLSMRLAEAAAYRASLRVRQFYAAKALQDHLRSHPIRDDDALKIEVALAETFATFPGGPGKAFFLIVIIRDEHGVQRALVGSDVTRLPRLNVGGLGDSSRRSAVEAADSFLANIFSKPTIAASSFLAHDDANFGVVVCPVFHHAPQQFTCEFAAWLSLSELSGSELFRPVAFGISRVGTFLSDSSCGLLLQGKEGSRELRPFSARPVRKFVPSAGWPRQREILERSDSLLRRHLLLRNPLQSAAITDYLSSWADRINPYAAIDLPNDLKGPPDFYWDARLALTPFPAIYATSRPTKVPVIPPQLTDYKPTSICPGILTPLAVRKILGFLRDVLYDLKEN